MNFYRIFSRLLQSILVLFGVFTLSFFLLQILPGDAILIKFQSSEMGLNNEQIAELRVLYGADSSIFSQYIHSLANFLVGNWGYSIESGVPVAELINLNLWPTVKLASLAFIGAVIIAILTSFLATFSIFSWLRSLFQTLPSLLISIPAFWLGIMLIQLISFKLRLIPVINPSPIEGLVLPVLTLAIPISAPIAQILIRNIDNLFTQPFVSVLRAKGATNWRIYRCHIFKNALLPTLTIAGILLGELIAGTVVTETVFGLNGLGSLTANAVSNQDTAVLQAVVLLSALAFTVINLVIDIIYPIIDPRLKSVK